MEKKTVILSDLRAAYPRDAILEKYVPGKWFAVPYTSEDGTEGHMLLGDDEFDSPPEITLDLNVSGVYKIFLGLNFTHTRNCLFNTGGEIWVKLTGDGGYTHIAREAIKGKTASTNRGIHCSIFDTYYTTDDLTGKSLHISVPSEPYGGGTAGICYVKLVPLTAEELAAHEKLMPTQDTKRGIMLWCGATLGGNTRGNRRYFPKNRRWFEDELTSCYNSDIGVVCAEIMRGNECMFKTTEGDMGDVPEDAYDILQGFSEACRGQGLKLWLGARFIGASYPIVKSDINKALFYWENQDLATRDKEGNPSNFTSFAYEKVQDHWLKIFEDALQYDIDGICVYLHRSFPFAWYEAPVCESFIEKYGIDPKTLPEDDERWLKHTGEYMTQFLRRVRALTRKYGNKTLAVYVKSTITGDIPSEKVKNNAKPYYVDVDTLVKEGVIDALLVGNECYEHQLARWKSQGDVEIYAELMPRSQPGQDYAKLMQKYYDMGADGYCLWDGNTRPARISEWNVVRRLGHRDMLDYLAKEAPAYLSSKMMKLLNGMSISISFTDG